MKRSVLRAIPSVDKILQALGDAGVPRPVVVAVVRRELDSIRKEQTALNFDGVLSRVQAALGKLRASRIQPVVNGTGILVHTNFGRAPLGPAVMETLLKIGSNYNNLEFGLTSGARSGRAAYLELCLALLCGAEAATVVNNNAAALVLILRHFCESGATDRVARSRGKAERTQVRKNEVIISRGELVQIGGGFRIPEILESSGARLREVGTTNKTSLDDYARAITRETAMILKVHHSNFYMGGFVESPSTEHIAKLARRKQIPFIEDLGSGAVIETQTIAGLEHEPTPAEVIRCGVDLVCFSGDKLLGGPQAGILAGKAKQIAALKREPFFRALRCDKLILSALETTADLYLRKSGGGMFRSKSVSGKQKEREGLADFVDIPVLEMLRVSMEELQLRAKNIIAALDGLPIKITVAVGRAQVGGGTLPRSALESVTLEITHGQMGPDEMAARLREYSIPIVGYISRGKFKLDLRTIFPRQDSEVIKAIRGLCA
jgi:L-seryl-tRNA(Ser) seleniumtransferase